MSPFEAKINTDVALPVSSLGIKASNGSYIASKTKQKQEMSAILKRGLDNPLDVNFALEYFRRQQPHLEAPVTIKIAPDDGRIKSNCFWTQRPEPPSLLLGEWTSEWMTIPTKKMLFARAMRYEIKPQTDAFRIKALSALSSNESAAFRGILLQVDHKEPTFQELLDAFIAERCGGKEPAFVVDRLADRAIASEWYKFHEERAVLQLLTVEQHKVKSAVDASKRSASKREAKRARMN